MSGLVVLPDPCAFDHRYAEADFAFYVPDPTARTELRVLKYYSPYEDLVVSPKMLDDFEHDIRHHEALYDLLGLPDGQPTSKAELVRPLIQVARSRDAYIVIVGD